MKTDVSALTGLGLSSHEAACYASLLKLGASPASRVATETGLQRTTVYPILRGLAERGIVNIYEKRGKRLYQAQNPDRVLGYYERKLKTFEESIPMLRALSEKSSDVVGLRFLETKKELEAFYRDVLEEYSKKPKKDRMYRILGSAPDWENINAEFFKWYRGVRAKAIIHTRLLLSEASRDINPTDPGLLRSCKFLPQKYSFKSTIDIFDDKIIVINPNPASLAVIIEVPTMVDIFKAVFDVLWDTTRGETL